MNLFRATFWILLLLQMIGVAAKGEVIADFQISRTLAGPGVPIEFRSTSTSSEPGKIHLKWEFGDGNAANGQDSLSHTYSKIGVFPITLFVENSKGETGQKTGQIEIRMNLAPSAEFYLEKSEFSVGDTLSFYSMAFDADGTIESLEWTLDNNIVGQKSVGSVVLASAGNFILKLEVQDNLGATEVVSKEIIVKKKNLLPDVSIDVDLSSLAVDKLVNFTAKARDPDGKIRSYYWKFDAHGRFVEGSANVSRAFIQEGEHQISLKVVDDEGGEVVVSEKVFIPSNLQLPEGEIRALNTKFVSGKKENFYLKIDKLKKKINRVEWNFGDGQHEISAGINDVKSNVYQSSGEYLITATLHFSDSSFYHLSKKISVLDSRNISRFTVNQVIVESKPHIELIPSQTRSLYFRSAALDGSDLGGFYNSTRTWTSSSTGVVSIVSSSDNYVTIKGIAAGTSFVKVIVDGVESQEIEVVVQPFVNDISVAIDGKYFDTSVNEAFIAINRPTNANYYPYAYFVKVSHGERYESLSGGYYSTDYLSYTQKFQLPNSISPVSLSTKVTNNFSPNVDLSNTRDGLRVFAGRLGFLYMPPTSAVQNTVEINYGDDRFFKLDQSFSISFWLSSNASETSSFLEISGDYIISVKKSALTVITNSGTRGLIFPNKDLNAWRHLTITYNHSSREMKGYFDGKLTGSLIIPASPIASSPEFIRLKNGNSRVLVDDLKFWSRVLTSQEVEDEVLNPQVISSSDLLSAFMFDVRGDLVQLDDAFGEWSLQLNPDGQILNSDNVILLSQVGKISDTIAANQSKVVSMTLNEGPFALGIPSDTFVTSQNIFITASSCELECEPKTWSVERDRVSPVIYVTPFSSPQQYMQMKIPYNSHSPIISDPYKLKVVRLDVNWTGWDFQIYEPSEINVEQGYVEVSFLKGGSYWVVQPYGFDSVKLIYSNTDLRKSIYSPDGRRTFYTTIATAANQYTLSKSSVGSQVIDSWYCNGNSPQQSVLFPITLTGLTETINYCYIDYRVHPGGFWNPAGVRDLIIIEKK